MAINSPGFMPDMMYRPDRDGPQPTQDPLGARYMTQNPFEAARRQMSGPPAPFGGAPRPQMHDNTGSQPMQPQATFQPTPQMSPPTRAIGFGEHGYLNANPDVAAAVDRGDLQSGAHHYASSGYLENRPGANFSEWEYRALNPDVTQAIAEGQFSSGLEHFISSGHAENRAVADPNLLYDDDAFFLNDARRSTEGLNRMPGVGPGPTGYQTMGHTPLLAHEMMYPAHLNEWRGSMHGAMQSPFTGLVPLDDPEQLP